MRRVMIGFCAFALLGACASDDSAADETDVTDMTNDPAAGVTDDPAAGVADDPAADVTDDPAAGDTTVVGPSADRDFSAIAPVIEPFITDRGLGGAGLVVVDRDDGIVYHHHWGEFDEERISLIASSSKMITAGVLMRLHDDGLLDVDAPVADAVSWGSANPEITPAQLLSNSSGLVGLRPNPAYGPYICQFLPAGTLQGCAEQIFTTSDDDDDIVAPDTEFRYGGAQWQVAGAVAEAVAGRSWAELIDEIYVEPCGLDTLGFNNHWAQLAAGGFDYPAEFDGDLSLLADTDNPSMEGGAYSTTGDYAQLLLMHLRGGRCGDLQVLSAESVDRLHADRIRDVYDGATLDGSGYGMGWWIDHETGRITDPGAYGSQAWLDLDDGYGAYLVIEADSDTGLRLAELLYDPVEAAMTGAN